MADEGQDLTVSVTGHGHGLIVVALGGELDFVSGSEAAARLAQVAADGGDTVVLDVSGVTFIDSTGLNALVTASKVFEARDRTVIVAGASPHVARVFEVVQLNHSFRLEATLDDALRI